MHTHRRHDRIAGFHHTVSYTHLDVYKRQQMMDDEVILSVQIKGVVNAGVIAYVQGCLLYTSLQEQHILSFQYPLSG